MIKALRVDDNLLHGQVAFSWVRNLKIHIIIIADNKVINDQFTKMTLGLSKPPGVILKIISVDNAINILNTDEYKKMNVMVIVNSLENAKSIIDNVNSIKSINLGLLRTTKEVVLKYENVYLNNDDLNICKELIKRNIEIEIRLRFIDTKIYLKDLL